MSNNDGDPYQKYLERKHGGFRTSESIIEEVVEKATGSILTERKQVIAGEVNEVYDVTTEKGQNVIVRISRQGNASFIMGLDLLDYYESENYEAGLAFTKERFLAEMENF
jgi:Ser/Thr protein kinase RdoA (MazF antagonist)